MTSPCYPVPACADGSQVCGDASDYAWNVSFNNGNSNNDNRDNNNRVRAVRVASSEFQGDRVELEEMYQAWKRARRKKVPSANQLAFDSRWADGLLSLQHELNSRVWQPRPSTSFITTRPKAREIHAPDFADRVVHHWLVPQLEAIWEPRFIGDSFANRRGKGSHAAVRCLQQFVRQVHSGQGGGYFLQLDIHNFFNSIHRPTLWRILKPVLERASLRDTALRATHALLRREPLAAGVIARSTAIEREQVPPHKQLANAPAGCGLPIGNLSSQFFANVYLDRLDQFVKHVLKAKRYVRYVDDFVLVHHDREQLAGWRDQIEAFLADELRLSLKAEQKLAPLSKGIDFLGYVVRPTHTTVRRRVVAHANEALSAWARGRVGNGCVRATPEDYRRAGSIWGSYLGHFDHADSFRLRERFLHRYPWLRAATAKRRFHLHLEGQIVRIRARTAQ